MKWGCSAFFAGFVFLFSNISNAADPLSKEDLEKLLSGNTTEGQKAIQLKLADQAIEAKRAIAKESTVVLLSDENSKAANLVTEAMTIIKTLDNKNQGM